MRKEKIQGIIDSLPADVDVEDFLEKLTLLERIEEAEQQIAAGDVIPHEKVVEQLKPWLK